MRTTLLGSTRRGSWARIAGTAVALGAVLTAVATLPGTAANAALDGCSSSGPYEVCFTDPTSDGYTILDRLDTMVRSAHSGDTIHIALYHWTRVQLPDGHYLDDDVIAAYRNGVDVRIVMSGDNPGTTVDDNLKSAGVPVRFCDHNGSASCLGTHIMHDKFFLFDIGGTRSVVQTSFNDTNFQLGLYNNMVRITGDAALYDYYLDYWHRLNAQSWTYDGVTWSNDDRNQLGSLDTKAYVFPRSSGDPVLGVLNEVTACRTGDAKIYLAESIFNSTREAIRNRLGYLEDVLGCNVSVVVQTSGDEQWAQSTTSGGYNLTNAKVRHAPLHDKYIIIDAKYNGSWQQVVWTGSHNLNSNSLRNNDEALVRVTDPFVFDQYHSNFLGVYGVAAGG